MNQAELIKKLGPTNFNPDIHTIIKARFKYSCQLCYRPYLVGEYISFNFEKKKGRHINCNSQEVLSRPKVSTKRKIGLNPNIRGRRKGSIK